MFISIVMRMQFYWCLVWTSVIPISIFSNFQFCTCFSRTVRRILTVFSFWFLNTSCTPSIYFAVSTYNVWSLGSSVSIVYVYGLEDQAIKVRSLEEARDCSCSLSSVCVQTDSGAHPAPVQWVPGDLSLGVKRGRGVTLTIHPHLVPRSWMSRSYTSSSPLRLHRRVVGLFYLHFTYNG
jgi:hypothetical protein